MKFLDFKEGKIKYIYLALRRRYLIWFKKKYAQESIALRQGKCKMCPCCYSRGLFNSSGRCKYLQGNKCAIYDRLKPVCRWYPIDEEDKTPFSKERRAYYWKKEDKERLKKKYWFIF